MNTVPAWATSGEELKADPETLKGYATNLATVAKNLSDDLSASEGVQNVTGVGRDQSLSAGGFAEGQRAQTLDSRNAQEILAYLGDQHAELLAHSSATHLLADMYETGEQNVAISLNSVSWAYQEPGASQPAGVPAHVFDENGDLITVASLYETGQVEDGGTASRADVLTEQICLLNGDYVTTYRTADGGERKVTSNARGSTEILTNAEGQVLYEAVTTPAGRTTTTFYTDGAPTGSTVHNTTTTTNGNVSHQRTSVENRDADGSVTYSRTDHVVTTVDPSTNTQTREYYTTEGDDPQKRNRHSIGSQPVPDSPAAWQELAEQRAEEARQVGFF